MKAGQSAWMLPILGMTSLGAAGQPAIPPATPASVEVSSGSLRLTALVFRPAGPGPFPAVLFNHGSGPTDPTRVMLLGPVFARHGYVLFCLFRRGDGLSARQGAFMGDLLAQEGAARGDDARRRLQLRLLTTDHLNDVLSGLAALRALAGVDPARVAVAGHSFGGQLAILAAERDHGLKAVVAFAAAALSWDESAELRECLLSAVAKARAPILLVHAANDFSTAPGETLAAKLKELGKPGGVKILRAVGLTRDEGHAAVYGAISSWEADVFGFLERSVGSEKERRAPVGGPDLP